MRDITITNLGGINKSSNTSPKIVEMRVDGDRCQVTPFKDDRATIEFYDVGAALTNELITPYMLKPNGWCTLSNHMFCIQSVAARHDTPWYLPKLAENGWTTSKKIYLMFPADESTPIFNSRHFQVRLDFALAHEFERTRTCHDGARDIGTYEPTMFEYARFLYPDKMIKELHHVDKYFSRAIDKNTPIATIGKRLGGYVKWLGHVGTTGRYGEINRCAIKHVGYYKPGKRIPPATWEVAKAHAALGRENMILLASMCDKCATLFTPHDIRGKAISDLDDQYHDNMRLVNTEKIYDHFRVLAPLKAKDVDPDDWENRVAHAKNFDEVTTIVNAHEEDIMLTNMFRDHTQFSAVKTTSKQCAQFCLDYVMKLRNCPCPSCKASDNLWWSQQVISSIRDKAQKEAPVEFKCVECGHDIHNKLAAYNSYKLGKNTGIPHGVFCCSCFSKYMNDKTYEQRIQEMQPQ
jgi:hypothetical protein